MLARTIFAVLFALLSLGAVVYYVLAMIAMRAFAREHESIADDDLAPPVSLLKPLKGTDPEMMAALRSHCMQNYPEYEIIFGVNAADDPAVAFVRTLQAEFPQQRIALVVCEGAQGTNRKAANLAIMAQRARYGHLLVNDSDILVSPDYLRRVLSPFVMRDGAKPVGMVTAAYIGVPSRSMWSRLESIGISSDFIPGVLLAKYLEGGISFGLGSTLAISRAALDAIGGFAPLADLLADDYELGHRIFRAGYDVVLSREVVKTFIHDYDLTGYWHHQTRWAHAVKDSRTSGYIGLGMTFGIVWSVLALLLAWGTAWAWALLVVVLAARMLMAYNASLLLADDHARRSLWLVPARDVLAFAVWSASFFGNTVFWRGERFRLNRGRLQKHPTRAH